MEDEIRQVCPIVYWHVWDNKPYPEFNNPFYEATDLINCHSHHTYEQVKEHHPNKTFFVPHALPEDLFFPVSEQEKNKQKIKILGPDREDHFVLFWMNRNARRKRPNDLLLSFKMFLDELNEKEGHKKATLLMHTDPTDREGPNLFAVSEMLGIKQNVVFSNQRVDFQTINLFTAEDHFGIISGSLWDHFGITFWVILAALWGHSGITLESLWDHSGITLGSL
ncbi:MAG: glycosyltransferase family 4 protein [Nitrospinae bacterium]|nr:glycosyltransferase family 4 protein [Nitrospinota bacterium]